MSLEEKQCLAHQVIEDQSLEQFYINSKGETDLSTPDSKWWGDFYGPKSRELSDGALDLVQSEIHHPLYSYKGSDREDRIVESNGGFSIDRIPYLKGRAYGREMSLLSFLIKMKAFEAVDLWQALGFAHIPIESIFSFRLLENGNIYCVSNVYDGDISSIKGTNFFAAHLDAIESQYVAIIEGLARLGLTNGDYYHKNIAYSLHRHADGAIDFQSPPKLFLLDWDTARVCNRASKLPEKAILGCSFRD